jgi:hypothetical protein
MIKKKEIELMLEAIVQIVQIDVKWPKDEETGELKAVRSVDSKEVYFLQKNEEKIS